MPGYTQGARFTEYLRECYADDWRAVVNHPFTDALAAGTIGDDAMRRYLIQDHRFLDAFVVLLASMVAHAPTLKDRIEGCQFLGLVTGKENTYFERSLAALGVDAEASKAAPMETVTQGFLDLMTGSAKSGKLHVMLSVLVVAEWSYLSWADRVKDQRGPDKPLWCNEWIDLHSGAYFESVIAYFRGLLDDLGPKLSDAEVEECKSTFGKAISLEAGFFDNAWALHK
mmetsp:Transcript_39064/g.92413  ORF Transcript_39064/g.92413 Transcript_39064/m.92413 type:complete len:227 (+) Transcript_39064:38-718(+)|eukprot:CAMPEP_0180174728 /NCGR_PEP_ID=MMETSP0986-20121125/36324_1 /TAXON_ID=697907 /ORGANISM="non described non described, Strain CCMP2293" /LENGTH=226 /DNA_ID=CAMNT_0022127123 /DNA_START=37 /DNA_END=717 /DNA_ORIENTATION=+